jgi:hypothetical protein
LLANALTAVNTERAGRFPALTPSIAPPYTVRVTGRCLASLAFLLVLVTAATALAEHEVYYRYTVLGYVKDAKGKPRQGVQLELVRDKTGFSYLGETDAGGLYVIVARLGDESAGETLRLQALKQTVAIAARFDPRDHNRERGTRVDFLGAKPVETPTAFAATLKQFLKQ